MCFKPLLKHIFWVYQSRFKVISLSYTNFVIDTPYIFLFIFAMILISKVSNYAQKTCEFEIVNVDASAKNAKPKTCKNLN